MDDLTQENESIKYCNSNKSIMNYDKNTNKIILNSIFKKEVDPNIKEYTEKNLHEMINKLPGKKDKSNHIKIFFFEFILKDTRNLDNYEYRKNVFFGFMKNLFIEYPEKFFRRKEEWIDYADEKNFPTDGISNIIIKMLNMLYNLMVSGDEVIIESFKNLYKLFYPYEVELINSQKEIELFDLYKIALLYFKKNTDNFDDKAKDLFFSTDKDFFMFILSMGARISVLKDIFNIKTSEKFDSLIFCSSDEFSVRRTNEEKYTEEERKAAFQDFKNIFDIGSEADYNKFQDKKIYNISQEEEKKIKNNEMTISALEEEANKKYYKQYDSLTCFFNKIYQNRKMITNFSEDNESYSDYIETIMVLKRNFPEISLTRKNIQTFAAPISIIDAAHFELENQEEFFNVFYKKEFDQITKKLIIKKPKEKEKIVIKEVVSDEVKEKIYNQNILLKEIDTLKKELAKSKSEYTYLSNLYTKEKQKKIDATEIKNQYLTEHAELIKLREYLYSINNEEDSLNEDDEKDIVEELNKLKISIIGGHPTVIGKLKQFFPNWKYYGKESLTTQSEKVIDNSDKVYFFTDYIGHSTYYKFVNEARVREIPFGFLRKNNHKQIISQMFDDCVSENLL